MLHLRIFIFTLVLILSCTTQKEGKQSANSDCTQEILVIDKTGIDGCGLLLQLPNGEKWMVVENLTGKTFKAGERWQIGYEKISDHMSVCMMEQAAVKVICQEKMMEKCVDERDVFKIPWLNKNMGDWQPDRVSKYPYQSQIMYVIERKTVNYLYNCQGKRLCAGKGSIWQECLAKYQADFGKEAIIYQGEGQID